MNDGQLLLAMQGLCILGTLCGYFLGFRQGSRHEDRLRAGLTRIAEGYGGDVQALAKNLLEGNA